MTISKTSLEIDSETARVLSEHAASFGLTVQEYLKKHFAQIDGKSTVDDADKWLDELSRDLPELPTLPADFSTRDACLDHD